MMMMTMMDDDDDNDDQANDSFKPYISSNFLAHMSRLHVQLIAIEDGELWHLQVVKLEPEDAECGYFGGFREQEQVAITAVSEL